MAAEVSPYTYLWSAICEEDAVSDDCEFWAFSFEAESEGVINAVWTKESSANTDSASSAEDGEDDVANDLCVVDEETTTTATCTYEVDSDDGSGYGFYFYFDDIDYITRRNLVDQTTA